MLISTIKYKQLTAAMLMQVIVLLPAVQAAETPTQLIEDAGLWMQAVAEGSLQAVDPALDKTRLWVETQARFDHDWEHWYQGMARVAAGYSISDRATIWAGYTYLPTQNLNYKAEIKGQIVNGAYIAQQDVWPAFRYVLPTEYGSFTFRTMWESNFGQGSAVRERPRQMIKFMHPFEFEPRLSLVVWDEAFYRVNTTSWGGKTGFDQNRAFLGMGWAFTKTLRSEFGYMNQYLDGPDHKQTTDHHLVMASVFVSF